MPDTAYFETGRDTRRQDARGDQTAPTGRAWNDGGGGGGHTAAAGKALDLMNTPDIIFSICFLPIRHLLSGAPLMCGSGNISVLQESFPSMRGSRRRGSEFEGRKTSTSNSRRSSGVSVDEVYAYIKNELLTLENCGFVMTKLKDTYGVK